MMWLCFRDGKKMSGGMWMVVLLEWIIALPNEVSRASN